MRPAFFSLRALLGLFCLVFVASCSDSRPIEVTTGEPPESPARPAAPTPQTPFDLGAVMEKARLAWRETEARGEWRGGHLTYSAAASEARLAMTPRGSDKAPGAAPITFETTGIGRGAPSVPERRGAWVEPDGHLAIGRGAAVEHLRNTEEGVHQSFRFEREPPGSGDLEVRLRVTGAEHAGASPEGHVFRDSMSGSSLRYGKATWVDARGAETAMVVRHLGGGELSLVVPESVLRGAAYPAEIDPIISAQIDVDPPVLGYARNNQDQPAAAFDGVNYLVVWQDSRAIEDNYSKIVGARVSALGVLLDPGGFDIFTSGSGTGGRPPAVAFDGTNYLVVNADNSGNIRANRVTPGGVVLDGGGGKTLGTTSSSVQEVAVAFGTTTYLVVWSTNSNGGDVKGRILDKNGVGVGAAFTISGATGGQMLPRLAFDGANYLVVWEDKRSFSTDIYGCRVSATGTVLDPAGIAITTIVADQTWPSVAFDGVNYLVAWQTPTSSSTDIVAARVGTDGVLLDPTGIVLSSPASTNSEPRVTFDGQAFLVLWTHYVSAFGNTYDVYANRVSGAGAKLDGTGTVVSAAPGHQQQPFTACGSAGCLAVWEDGRGNSVDVFGARLSAGAPIEASGIHISNAAGEETKPSIAFGSGVYFVVWEGLGSGAYWTIYGARVDAAGTVLDPAGIVIAQGAYDHHDPRVAASNGGFLVVWEDARNGSSFGYTDVFASRVTPGGVVLDPAGIPLTTDQDDDLGPVVASDGTGYLVAWQDLYGPGVNNRIHATRVNAAGTVLDTTPIQPVVSGSGTPAVTFGGGQYFLVWNGSGIRGARITTAGVVLDASPGIAVGGGDYPSVGFDGQSFVVAYRWFSGGTDRMWAARVSGAGVNLDPAGIQLSTFGPPTYTSAGYRLGPEVSFDGVDTVVSWALAPGSGSVYGAWITPTGKLLGAGPLVTSSVASIHSTAIAGQGDGHHSLLAYTFGDPAPGVKNYRVKANLVTAKTNGEACALAVECKSSFCVDSVCCNVACGGGATNDCQACSVAAGAAVDGVCGPLTGTACSDGNACTQADTCSNGACSPGAPLACTALDSCHSIGTCQAATGLCTNPAKANGASCNDGNACSQTDTCQGGNCVGASPITCAPADACHLAGVCQPATGACDYAPKPEGTTCSDGNACSAGDSCQSGVCAPGAPVVCAPPSACHQAGVCNAATGQCAYASAPNDTACDDGNPCTQSDACKSGACLGGNPVACPAPSACMQAGTCDVATGQCTFTPKANGTACDDGNPCTLADTCQAGSCAAGAPKACAAPMACQEEGTCDATTGQCTFAKKPDGASCDDEDACTQLDACQNGACAGSDPVVCAPKDECHEAGSCAASTGLCTTPSQPDGTACTDGACEKGVCTPSGTSSTSGSSSGSTAGAGGGSTGTGSGGGSDVGSGSVGSGGSAGQGSSSSGGALPSSEGGCGCRTASSESPAGGISMILALSLLARRRRSTRGAWRGRRAA